MSECPLCGDAIPRRLLAAHVHGCLERVQLGWRPLPRHLRSLLGELALECARAEHGTLAAPPAGQLLLSELALPPRLAPRGAALTLGGGDEQPLSVGGVAPVVSFCGGTSIELKAGAAAGAPPAALVARVPLAATISSHALPHWRMRTVGAWGGLARCVKSFDDVLERLARGMLDDNDDVDVDVDVADDDDDGDGVSARVEAGATGSSGRPRVFPRSLLQDRGHLVGADGPLTATHQQFTRAVPSGAAQFHALSLAGPSGCAADAVGGWLGVRSLTAQLLPAPAPPPPPPQLPPLGPAAATATGGGAPTPAVPVTRRAPLAQPRAPTRGGGGGCGASWSRRLLDALRCATCEVAAAPPHPPPAPFAPAAPHAACYTAAPPPAPPAMACTLRAVYVSLRDVIGPPGSTPSLTPLHRCALDGNVALLRALVVSCGAPYLLARTHRLDGGVGGGGGGHGRAAPTSGAPPPPPAAPASVAFGHLTVLDAAILSRQAPSVAAILAVQPPSARLSMPSRSHALHFAVLAGNQRVLRAVVAAAASPAAAFAAARRRQAALRRLGFAEGRGCVDHDRMRATPQAVALLGSAPLPRLSHEEAAAADDGVLLAAVGIAGDATLGGGAHYEPLLTALVAAWNDEELRRARAGGPPQRAPHARRLRRMHGQRNLGLPDGHAAAAVATVAGPPCAPAVRPPPAVAAGIPCGPPRASSSSSEAVAFFLGQLAAAARVPLAGGAAVSLGSLGGPASRDRTGSPLSLTTALGPLPTGYGALDVADRLGRTPLAWAAILGNAAAVSLLLAKGCCAWAPDGEGSSPLLLALACGHAGIALQLLARVSADAVAAAAREGGEPPSHAGAGAAGDGDDDAVDGDAAPLPPALPRRWRASAAETPATARYNAARGGGGSGSADGDVSSPTDAEDAVLVAAWDDAALSSPRSGASPPPLLSSQLTAHRPPLQPATAAGRRLVTAAFAAAIVPNPLFGGGRVRPDAEGGGAASAGRSPPPSAVSPGAVAYGSHGLDSPPPASPAQCAAAATRATLLPSRQLARAAALLPWAVRAGSQRVTLRVCRTVPPGGRSLPPAAAATAATQVSVPDALAAASRCKPLHANLAGETALLLAARAVGGGGGDGGGAAPTAAAPLDVLALLVELGAHRSAPARPPAAWRHQPRTAAGGAGPPPSRTAADGAGGGGGGGEEESGPASSPSPSPSYRDLLDDVIGETPLHAAAKRGSLPGVRILTLLPHGRHYAAVAALPVHPPPPPPPSGGAGLPPPALLCAAPLALPTAAEGAVTSAAFAPVLAALGWLPVEAGGGGGGGSGSGGAPTPGEPPAAVGRFCERLTVLDRDGAGRTPLDCARLGLEARRRGGAADSELAEAAAVEQLLARLQAVEAWLFGAG